MLEAGSDDDVAVDENDDLRLIVEEVGKRLQEERANAGRARRGNDGAVLLESPALVGEQAVVQNNHRDSGVGDSQRIQQSYGSCEEPMVGDRVEGECLSSAHRYWLA